MTPRCRSILSSRADRGGGWVEVKGPRRIATSWRGRDAGARPKEERCKSTVGDSVFYQVLVMSLTKTEWGVRLHTTLFIP